MPSSDQSKLASVIRKLRQLSPVGTAEAMIVPEHLAGPAEDTSKWPRDPIGGGRYREVDDSQTGFPTGFGGEVKRMLDETIAAGDPPFVSGKRSEVFPHDKLDPMLPKKNRETELFFSPKRTMLDYGFNEETYGFYDPNPSQRGYLLNADRPDQDSTMIHEMQHEVDDAAGIVQKGRNKSYLQQDPELRARVVEQRRRMSPIERYRFPYEDHAKLEIERVKNPNAQLEYAENTEIQALVDALRARDIPSDATAEIANKVLNSPGYLGLEPGSPLLKDKPGKQRHYRSRSGDRTWLEIEKLRQRNAQ